MRSLLGLFSSTGRPVIPAVPPGLFSRAQRRFLNEWLEALACYLEPHCVPPLGLIREPDSIHWHVDLSAGVDSPVLLTDPLIFQPMPTPADAEIPTSQVYITYLDTTGAPVITLKGKDDAGTVFTTPLKIGEAIPTGTLTPGKIPYASDADTLDDSWLTQGTDTITLTTGKTFDFPSGSSLTAASGSTITLSGTTTVNAPLSYASGKKQTFAATSTAAASVNLPHGTAPSTPADGDFWSTTAGFYGRANGTTKGPFVQATDITILIDSSTTAVGNQAASEDNIADALIPADTLSTNKDTIRFYAAGTIAGTAATDKRVRVKFHTATIYDSGTLAITSAASWWVEAEVMRSSSGNQKCIVRFGTSDAALLCDCGYMATTITDSSAAAWKVTGEATNADDVVCEFWKLWAVPAEVGG